MKEREGGREEIRDHYEGQEVSIRTAKDSFTQLETGAKDSPAMTGESEEETNYNFYEE